MDLRVEIQENKMTPEQWTMLLDAVEGRETKKPVTGLIIDSPWLPGWYGITTLQYYASGEYWFAANMKAVSEFPDVIFLPGFWSEYGMCTEPSAFGSKLIWNETSLPVAGKVIGDITGVRNISKPDPGKDGLLPMILLRLEEYHDRIREAGHEIRFAVARGPLNIASFLMGTTEFMMALMTNPDECHQLLQVITGFITDWLQLQKEKFPSIDGILILDDMVGFLDEGSCREFAIPALKEVFSAFPSGIRFFHNDASGIVSTPFLKEAGINLYNFSFEHPIAEIRKLAGDEVCLLGNLPPRDVLAAGPPEKIREKVKEMIASAGDPGRIVWSVGGGMPQGVSTENLRAFLEAVNEHTSS